MVVFFAVAFFVRRFLWRVFYGGVFCGGFVAAGLRFLASLGMTVFFMVLFLCGISGARGMLYNSPMILEWWHWVVFGLAVLVADVALVNVYFLLWFGVGAAAVGLCLLVWPEMSAAAQVGLWAFFSLSLLVLWVYLWRPRMMAREAERLRAEAGDEIVGMAGVIVRGGRSGGLIRFQRPVGGRDVWPFAAGGAVYKPGERATVEDIGGGGKLIIRREESGGELNAENKNEH